MKHDPVRLALALDFCKTCLGWPDASGSGSRSIVESKPRPELPHISGKIRGFQIDPTDPGQILNAVKEWCDSNAVSLSLKYSPDASSDSWHVRLAPHTEAHGDDLCDVLLRACLAANRNLSGQNASAEVAAIPIKNNPAILTDPWGDIRKNGSTALAFCKECLGWSKARLSSDWGFVFVSDGIRRERPGIMGAVEQSFNFNENFKDRVMQAVRTWCDARVVGFVLEYFPSGSAQDCWRASIDPDAETHGDGASAALMSACVAAHRKVTLPENSACLSVEPHQ